MKDELKIHSITFKDVTIDDTSLIKIEAMDKCSEAKLTVLGKWYVFKHTSYLLIRLWTRMLYLIFTASNLIHFLIFTEGDPYFISKLQNYTAVEKDEVVFQCEVSKSAAPVKWFKDGKELILSKNIQIKTDGRKRILIMKRAMKNDQGQYSCDCGSDNTSANLNIEGKNCCIPL